MNKISDKIKESREYIAVGIFAVILAVFGGKELKDQLLGDNSLDAKTTHDIERTIDDIVNNDSAFNLAGYKFSFKADALKKEHFLENMYSLLAYLNDYGIKFEARYGTRSLFNNKDNLSDDELSERLNTLLQANTIENITIDASIPDSAFESDNFMVEGMNNRAVSEEEVEYAFEKMKEHIKLWDPSIIRIEGHVDHSSAVKSIDFTFINTPNGTYTIASYITEYPIVDDSGTPYFYLKVTRQPSSTRYHYANSLRMDQGYQTINADSYIKWKAKQK